MMGTCCYFQLQDRVSNCTGHMASSSSHFEGQLAHFLRLSRLAECLAGQDLAEHSCNYCWQARSYCLRQAFLGLGLGFVSGCSCCGWDHLSCSGPVLTSGRKSEREGRSTGSDLYSEPSGCSIQSSFVIAQWSNCSFGRPANCCWPR